jgi:hypothetical protein
MSGAAGLQAVFFRSSCVGRGWIQGLGRLLKDSCQGGSRTELWDLSGEWRLAEVKVGQCDISQSESNNDTLDPACWDVSSSVTQ